MQQSHHSARRKTPRTAPALPQPGPAPAPVIGPQPSALSLPALSAAIPRRFVHRSGDDGLAAFATMLLDAGALQPRHWGSRLVDKFSPNASRNLRASAEHCLKDLTDTARPDPLVDLKLYFSDDNGSLDCGCDPHQYADQKKIKPVPAKVGVLAIHIHAEAGPMHQSIGPVLLGLETASPRLGQTVLNALDAGLDASCRGLTPRSGYGWAQFCYWGGEADETMRVEEELGDLQHMYNEKPKEHEPPTEDDVEIFRKRDYDKAIPGWAGSGRISPLGLPAFIAAAKHHRITHPAIAATVALKQRLARHRRDHTRPDNGLFESVSFEICPFLLRWSDEDPLAQIWDDVVNNIYEGGQEQVDVNTVFAFHDSRTLRHALNRLRNHLEILQLTENLIRALDDKPKKLRVRA